MSGEFHSGFVAIVGRPNVGKSTLVNYFANQKIAIVSKRPQTTRHQIRCIVNQPDAQIIFIDTPGFHKPFSLLGKHLNLTVRNALQEVDIILFMVDVLEGIGRGDAYLALELKKLKTPTILVLNKVDAVEIDRLDQQLKLAKEFSASSALYVVSALTGSGMTELLNGIVSQLPPGPQYYPEGIITDQPERMIIAEFIREKALELMREEVPYSVAVEIEEIKPRKNKDLLDVSAIIYVERDSQKGIVIGKHGQMLKEIGTRARQEIERLLGSQINLQLWVKVEKDWSHKESILRRMEY